MSGVKLFIILLQITFIVLWLCNVIAWPLWLVLLPVIILASLSLVIFVLYTLMYSYVRKLQRKEFEKYGASNMLQYKVKKMKAMQEEMEQKRKSVISKKQNNYE